MIAIRKRSDSEATEMSRNKMKKNIKSRSLIIPHSVVKMVLKKTINSTDAYMLALIHSFTEGNRTRVNSTILARRAGRDKRHVRHIMSRLIKAGLITVEGDRFITSPKREIIVSNDLGFPVY